MPTTYEPIATTTLGTATPTITFSSIPSTYTDLRIVYSNVLTASSESIRFRVNGITTGVYGSTILSGDGATAESIYASSATSIYGTYGGVSSATIPSFFTVDLFSYAGSKRKTMLITYQLDRNGSGAVGRVVGSYNQTTAVTSFTILTLNGANFSIGTTATLYGIKAA